MSIQALKWRIIAWWIYTMWHPVRDRSVEYAALIALAVSKAARSRRSLATSRSKHEGVV